MPRLPFASLDTLLLMDPSAESYERLLNWLHPNREVAEKEYLRILTLLIKKFIKQERADPEYLAELTMDRVAQTLTDKMVDNWVGAKEPYCYRVAYYILCEDRVRRAPETQMPDGFDVPQLNEEQFLELQSYCLHKCLEAQPVDKRELVVRYYRGMKAIKIQNRAQLARERRLTLPVLRMTAKRIREALKTCIEKCLEDAASSNHSLPM